MTDSPDSPDSLDPLDPRDELASAYLDGETTPDEARRVEGDPDLLARVARLEQVAAAVGSPTEPADAARRESAVAAALSAGTQRPVDELAATRARRSQRARVLSIAAAIALLVLAVPLLARLGDDTDDDTTATATADEEAEDRSSDRTDEDAAAAAGGGTSEPASPEAGPSLGEFDSLEQLAAAFRADPPSEDLAPTSAESGADRQASSCVDAYTGVVRVASAALDDLPVLVLVIDRERGAGRHLVVVDAASCDELADLPL